MRGKIGTLMLSLVVAEVSFSSWAVPNREVTVVLLAGKEAARQNGLEGARVAVTCDRTNGESWERLARDENGVGRFTVAVPGDVAGCSVWGASTGRGFARTGPVDPTTTPLVDLELAAGARVTFRLREGATGCRVLKGTMSTIVEWQPKAGQEWVTLPEGLVTADVGQDGRWTVGPLRPGKGGSFRITCRDPERGELVLKLADLRPGQTVDLGTLELWERTRLCGRVEPAPRAWEEVTVLMRPVNESGSPNGVRADGQGWFCFEAAQAGRPTLVWTADAFKTEGKPVEVVPPADELVVPRPQVGLLRGRVVAEEDGSPVEAFTVSILVPPPVPGLPQTPMSEELQTLVKREYQDPTGSFEIALPPADAFAAEFLEIRVEAPDYAPRVLRVEDGAPDEPLEIALLSGGALEGTVSTRWGSRLEGAEIRLRRDAVALPVVYAAETDAEGGFRISHLAPGSYGLEVRHPRFLTLRRTIEIQNDATEVDLVVEEGRPLWGTVVARATQEPIQDARVLAAWEGGLATGVSGADGCFELEPAPPENVVNLSVSAEGFAYWRGSLEPGVGAAEGGIRVELDEGRTFSGRVLGLGGDGSGASVWLSAASSPTVLTATTQTGGRFVVAGRISGVVGYTVRHRSLSRTCKGTISVPEGSNAELLLDCVQPGVSLTGTVSHEDGSAAAGLSLLLLPSGSSGRRFAAESDPSGAFSFEVVPPAEYSLLAVEADPGRSALLWRGYLPSSGLELTLRLPPGW